MIRRLARSVSVASLALSLCLVIACGKTAGTGNGDSYVGGNGKLSKADVTDRLNAGLAEAVKAAQLIATGRFNSALYVPSMKSSAGCPSIIFACSVLDGLSSDDAKIPGDQLVQDASSLASVLGQISVQLVDDFPNGVTFTQDPKMVVDLSATPYVVYAIYKNIDDAKSDTAESNAAGFIHEGEHLVTGLSDQQKIKGALVQDVFTLAGVLASDLEAQFGSALATRSTSSGAGSGSGSGGTLPQLPPPPGFPSKP